MELVQESNNVRVYLISMIKPKYHVYEVYPGFEREIMVFTDKTQAVNFANNHTF